MIKILGSLPQNPVIALSGGVDSMALADFVSRTRSVRCAFFHHGTETSAEAEEFLSEYCEFRGWKLIQGRISKQRDPDVSPEEHWREQRYAWLDSLEENILTAHHLDDSVETYLWSMMHGTAKLIPYQRNRVFRPLLLTVKADLVAWCKKNAVPCIDDKTNMDLKYMRNFVRHELLPRALVVNPGLHKVVSRKIHEQFSQIDT